MVTLYPDRVHNALSLDRVHYTRGAGGPRRLVVAVPAQSHVDHLVMPKVGMQFPRKLSYEKSLPDRTVAIIESISTAVGHCQVPQFISSAISGHTELCRAPRCTRRR
jgi:hypothetical protein